MRSRDLDTLELPRALEAIATLARSEAGRDAVRALRPAVERAAAERRLDTLAELVALTGEAGSLPTADVPRLAPALAQAAPAGAALETRRLLEVRDLLLVARSVRVHLRRDPDRFALLAGRRRRPAGGARGRGRAHHAARRRRSGARGRQPGARRRAPGDARAAHASRSAAPEGRARAGERRRGRRAVRDGPQRPLRRAHPHRGRMDLRGRGAGPLAIRRDGLRRAAVRRRAQQSPPPRVEDRGGGGATRARGADGAHPHARAGARSAGRRARARRRPRRGGRVRAARTRACGPCSAATRSACSPRGIPCCS